MTPPQKQLPAPTTQPLTDDEIKSLRAVLGQDEFVRRFWASVRAWVIAGAAVLAALTVGVESVAKALNWIRGK